MIELRIQIPSKRKNFINSIEFALDALGISYARDVSSDGAISAYFEQQSESTRLIRNLKEIFGGQELSFEKTKWKDKDWGNPWENERRNIAFKHFVVAAASFPEKMRKPIIKILADQSFGDSRHVTTRLMLKTIDKMHNKFKGQRVLDIGTGSGLLAIVAKRLGASKVVATEMDGAALKEAKINNKENRTQIEFKKTSAIPKGKFDFIFCNILFPEVFRLMPKLRNVLAKGGLIFLTGFNESQRINYVRHCKVNKLRVVKEFKEKKWIAAVLAKK